MKAPTVLSILGTRPEAIKMAPVIRELRKHDNVTSRVCVTAQHRELLDQVLTLFKIVPDFDLDLMRPSQTPNQLVARITTALDGLLGDVRPDWILVQGDTTTVMSAAIAAKHRGVQVGHVEAGLRTHDIGSPFPEEMNRIVADALSDLHFVPTPRARENLLREGIADTTIALTGNTVIDALLDVVQIPWTPKPNDALHDVFCCNAAERQSERVVLVTMHRRESFGGPLMEVCHALKELAQTTERLRIVFPVHPNPAVREPVHRLLSATPGITLTSPLDYLSLVNVMKRSTLILTDSGGIQEEAPTLGVPVLVLRKVTERPEGVEAGAVRVVGIDRQPIVDCVLRLLSHPREYQAMARAVNPYGDGHAAERIVARLLAESDCANGAGDLRSPIRLLDPDSRASSTGREALS